jgi:hypothetical protein
MNLSFVPGELYLRENAEGVFIVTVAGRKVLSTKSRRSALGRFHNLRAELEKKSPAQEPTAADKSELLRNEVSESILTEKTPARTPSRISSDALFEVENAFRAYCADVEESDLSVSSQATYVDMASGFIRWLKGDFSPGSRVLPYRGKKKKVS